MPVLVKKVITRQTFEPQGYAKAKGALWNLISLDPKKVPGADDSKRFTKQIDALSLHMGGMSIRDAALAHGIQPGTLQGFKDRWLNRDPNFRTLLANLLEGGAIRSMQVFAEKAENMSAPEAASAAATLTKSAVALRVGEATGYQVPENVALATLDRVAGILEACKARREQETMKPILDI